MEEILVRGDGEGVCVGRLSLGCTFDILGPQIMSDYELVLIFSPKTLEAADKTVAALAKVVTGAKGKVNKQESWGERALSYPIKKYTEGLYYFIDMSLEPGELSRFERKVKMDESIIRYLLVKKA